MFDIDVFQGVESGMDLMKESVTSFRYQSFTDSKLYRFAKKLFVKNGLILDSVKVSKKPQRMKDRSVHEVKMTLDNGLAIFLFVAFESKGKKIEPRDRGIIYAASVGSKNSFVPFSMEKNKDLPFEDVLGIVLSQAKTMIPKHLKKQRRAIERKSRAADLVASDTTNPEVKRSRTVAQKIKSTTTLIEANKSQAKQLVDDKSEYQNSIKKGGDEIILLKKRIETLDSQIIDAEKRLSELKKIV